MYTSVTIVGLFCHLPVSDAHVANPTWHVYKGVFFSSRFPHSFLHRVSFFLHISSSSIVFPSSFLLLPSFCCLFQIKHNTNSNSFISLTKSSFENWISIWIWRCQNEPKFVANGSIFKWVYWFESKEESSNRVQVWGWKCDSHCYG